ncbi:MAG: hypothetical protein FWD13_08250 [Treponema sp.]|nr:hypothetical protein [Treponema sp.]
MKNYFLLLAACILLGSCSTPDVVTIARILGGSSQALTFLSCKAVSEDEVEFVFSHPVTVNHLSFTPDLSVVSIENGRVVRVKLAENPEPGRLITADLLAEDEKRNSINVLVSFRARNNRMPVLVINELCTEYSNPRTEFIEFKMRSAGNLGGMRVFIIGNSNAARETIYEFPPVEVRNGEYVVLHLRTVEDSSRDELGSNLAESGGRNASRTARDFWIPGNTKLLHKTAIVYVLDQDDNVLNAVMICENPNSPWPRDYFSEAAHFLFEKEAWKSSDGETCRPIDAVRSAGTTNTRTINRDEARANTNSAADWYITATSSATPGTLNNTRRYSN